MSETIPDDLRETVEQIASDLDDIHFNSRHGSWLESAKHIIARALVAERLAATERAAKIAEAQITEPGLSDNPAYIRYEPSHNMAKKIAAAIRSQP